MHPARILAALAALHSMLYCTSAHADVDNWAWEESGLPLVEPVDAPLSNSQWDEIFALEEPLDAPETTAEFWRKRAEGTAEPKFGRWQHSGINTGDASVQAMPLNIMNGVIEPTSDWATILNNGWGMQNQCEHAELLALALKLIERQDQEIQRQEKELAQKKQQVETLILLLIRLAAVIALAVVGVALKHFLARRLSPKERRLASPLTKEPW